MNDAGPGTVWDHLAPHTADRDGPAVIGPDATVAWGEIDRLTARASAALAPLATGGGPAARSAPESGRTVGLLAGRSAAGLVVLLAALRRSVALVVLDPDLSPTLLRAQLSAAGVGTVVSCPGTAALAATLDRPVVALDPFARSDPPDPAGALGGRAGLAVVDPQSDALGPAGAGPGWGSDRDPTGVDPDDDALVVVTSPASGRLAAVVHTQRSLLGDLDAGAALGIAADDVVLVVASPAASTWFSSTVAALARGATVVLADSVALEPGRFASLLAGHGVTTVACGPALHAALLGGSGDPAPHESLRQVVLDGDRPSPIDVERHRAVLSGVDLVNRYSTPETLGVAALRVPADAATSGGPPDVAEPLGARPLAVGRPMPGREVRLESLPAAPGPPSTASGVPGVVHVVAAALGDRYAGDPERSAAVFGRVEDGRAAVRTGDLAVVGEGGVLELRGFVDQLVTVNGRLVDLGEVAEALRSMAAVGDALVRLDGRRLIAQVEPAPGVDRLDARVLRAELAHVLPLAAVPRDIEVVDTLTRGPRDASPGAASPRAPVPLGPTHPAPAPVPAAPRSPAPPPDREVLARTQREIAAVTAALLGVPSVDPDDDLVTLGADDRAVAALLAVVGDRYRVELTPRDLVAGSTSRDLARLAMRLVNPVERPSRIVRPPRHGGNPGVTAGGGGPVGPAVVVIPGVTATTLTVLPLARRLERAGLDPLLVDSGVPPRRVPGRSVAGEAAAIVGDLGALVPSGPVVVVGCSYGSLVAQELATRLTATGRPVPLLALLDPVLDDGGARVADRRRATLRLLDAAERGAAREAAAAAAALAVCSLPTPVRVLADRAPRPLVPWVEAHRSPLLVADARRVAGAHRPRPWEGPALLVWGRRPGGPGRWGDLLVGPVEEVSLGGEVPTILDRSQVDDVAAAILGALDLGPGDR